MALLCSLSSRLPPASLITLFLEAYALDSGIPMTCLLHDQMFAGNRCDRHRLLEQAGEQLPSAVRQAPGETERELIQIRIEMISRNAALVQAQEPPFQQCRHAMDAGQEGRGRLPSGAIHARTMDVPQMFQAGGGGPPIGDHNWPRGLILWRLTRFWMTNGAS